MLQAIKKEILLAFNEVKVSRLISNLSYQLERRQHVKRLPPLSNHDQLMLESCRQTGVAMSSLAELDLPSTDAMLKAAFNLLPAMEMTRAKEQRDGWHLGTQAQPAYPQIFTVTDLPEFARWATESRLLNMIETYLGVPIAFQGVHLRRDFANESPVTTELWHRDREDRHLIKIFVYLFDVTEAQGPFECVPANQLSFWQRWLVQLGVSLRRIKNPTDFGISDNQFAKIVPKTIWQNCAGKAGTVIFADTARIFHHGKSRTAGRAALFFVYTAQPPLRPEDCSQYHDHTFARPNEANQVTTPNYL